MRIHYFLWNNYQWYRTLAVRWKHYRQDIALKAHRNRLEALKRDNPSLYWAYQDSVNMTPLRTSSPGSSGLDYPQ